MEKQFLGACGLDCGNCPVLIAAKNNDNELRAKTARDFSELYKEYIGGYAVKPEDMNCNGCQSESGIFRGCEFCAIRKCCHGKNFANCANCIEYSQCEMLNGFYSIPAHRHAKDNLDKLRLKN
ncbi:MAG: DUF3795 domain-containing protein [Peptococcaceae bacterium]